MMLQAWVGEGEGSAYGGPAPGKRWGQPAARVGEIVRVWLGARDGDGGEGRGGVDRTSCDEAWARDGGRLGLRPGQAQVPGAETRMEHG